MRGWVAVALSGLLTACSTASAPPSSLSQYVGRFAAGPLDVLTISETDRGLAVSPPYWQSVPVLAAAPDQPDTYIFALPEIRPDRTIQFVRDATGAIVALRTQGVEPRIDALGAFHALPENAVTPIDQIVSGDVDTGISAAREASASDADLLGAAQRLTRFPSRAAINERLLQRLAADMPQSADVQVLLGMTRMTLGKRTDARAAYDRALALQPEQPEATLALSRLDAHEPARGEGYRRFFPYSLEALFASPTGAEIAAVRADWVARDLRSRNVEEVATLSVSIGGTPFVAHVLRHDVHDQAHVGVVFVPEGAQNPLPVIVDARGVDPTYRPLNLDSGSRAMKQLGAARAGFIFVVPAFRGETLHLAGQSFTAEGNPANGWDGAADDAIALLSVALESTPQADPRRITAFGQSRGGTVAMLMGIRDRRIGVVVAQSGPVDWFSAMDQEGWRTSEVIHAALADGVAPTPTEEGGQFYERVIQPVYEVRMDLTLARRRLIASSPLYFAPDLPRTIAMYGGEDRAVPVANARALVSAVGVSRRVRVIVFPDRGHDVDLVRASELLCQAVGARRSQH